MNTLGERIDWAMRQKLKTRKQLAEELDVSVMAIGDLINDKTKKPRNLLEISMVLGVNPVWLQSGIGEPFEGSTDISAYTATEDDEDNITLDVLDIEASAGHGAVNGDMVQVVKQLKFVPDQFHKYYPGITPANIRIINVKGDSMFPTFNNGDLLFVDISIQYFDGDGIYIFTFDDTLFVKRVQKIGRDYCIISDNDDVYKPWYIKPEEASEMFIHGKVRVHQSQKLNFVG
ncbi:hypothetical protein BKG95_02465 [Rodentibacter pneumotropicus]|uniref:Helix-turn-helix transcriptional regulator n=1 Tax=Rodentibacter pneumotropicus TaxID=758 RepID=A0AAW5LBF7_9PAST|nr:helix-turn-helix transcriptional regulator [Rodentibacter pneumotropicus]MCQ9120979.1 helix-turn-helix transcriptional regulator [Rodentibacter pneumotropicus]OOF69149.1 hypothetical protein BKG95_02465 [Rodentibacter pneumotropicus]